MFSKKLVLFMGLLIVIYIIQANAFKTNNVQACKCMQGEKCIAGVCIEMDPLGSSTSSKDHTCGTKWSGSNISVCTIGTPFMRNCVGSAGCSATSYKYCTETRCGVLIGGIDKWKTGDDISVSGDTCTVTTYGKDTCDHIVIGNWDKSDGKCVRCVAKKETEVAGDMTANYVVSVSGVYVVSAIGIGKADLKFEHACGADMNCDEKVAGDTCDTDKTCDANGACVAASGLFLSAVANPTAMAILATSTITFKVTFAGVPVAGALVDSVTRTAGTGTLVGDGSVCTSDECCTTNAAGECNITFTNTSGLSEVVTITSAKATDGVNIDSGSASAIVTVDSADWECAAGPDYGNLCSGGSDFGSCSSLNGTTDGCAGEWKNCGSFGCNPACNALCGCFTKYEACKCVCSEASCTEAWGAWSAWSACSAGSQSSTQSDANNCSSDKTKTQYCCTTTDVAPADGLHDDCVGASGAVCNTTSFPNGKCVECIVNDDCVGTDVCYDGACVPCSGEGDVPPADSVDLCCEGLDYWDKNFDGNPVCTSACNPTIGFLCNTLRSSVDNIAQAGEQLIGYILGIIGSVALLLIIIAGIMYMTAAGVEEKITSAKRILSGAVIGLGIALLAFSLLQVIMTVLNM